MKLKRNNKNLLPETKKIGKRSFEETLKLVEKVEKKIESMNLGIKENNNSGYVL